MPKTSAPKPEDVKDEPGAEERFMRGVKRALEMPPKPHEVMRLRRQLQNRASRMPCTKEPAPKPPGVKNKKK